MKHLLQIETSLFIDLLLFLTLSYAEVKHFFYQNNTSNNFVLKLSFQENSTLIVRSVIVMEPNDNNTTKTASKEQLEKFEDNLSLIPLTTNTQMLYDILKSLPPLLKLVEKEFSAVPSLGEVIARLDSKIFDFLQQISDHLPLSLPKTFSSSSNHSTKVDEVKLMTISNQWNLVIEQMEELVNTIVVANTSSSSHPPSELQKWICKALHGIEKIMKRFSNKTKEDKDKNSPATESPREVLEDLQEAVFFAFELFEYGEPRAVYSEKEDTLVLKYSDAK